MSTFAENRIETKLEEELRNAYEKLGKCFYEKNTDANIKAEYQEEFEQIERLLEEKRTVEIKMLARQGKRKCTSCSNILILESRFCNMCGEKLEEIPEELLKDPVAVLPPSRCSSCGELLDEDAVFCSSCGKKCD